jgi:hypothetical protein
MDRRTFLAGVAGAAAASSVGLAGCLGGDGDAATTDWIPAPDLFDAEGYRAFSTAPSALAEIQDSLTPSVVKEYEERILDWQVADPMLGDVDRYTSGEKDDAGYIAVEHGLDSGMLASNLESDGFSAAGEHSGFDLYETGDGASARALDDGQLVAGVDPDDGGRVVEGVIDASGGDRERYHEANDAVADVVEAIDTTDNFWIEGYQRITDTVAARGIFTDSIARGYSILLDSETVEATRVEAFTEDADVEEAAINTYTEKNPLFDGAQGLDWRVDGRMLVIEWTADPAELSLRQLG